MRIKYFIKKDIIYLTLSYSLIHFKETFSKQKIKFRNVFTINKPYMTY